MALATADAPAELVSSPFQLPASPNHEEMLAKYFRAFGDPIRLTILELVADSERSVGEIVAATGQSQPKISNNLACLLLCDFDGTRRAGRRVYYSLADARITALLHTALALL